VAGEFCYDYHITCCCGTEFETDDPRAYEKFGKAHKDCIQPEDQALTLLTRLVTAAESIVDHCKGDLDGGKT